MTKALMTGLALVAFLLAGLSVETWRHAKAFNDPIRERWYAFLIMLAAALVMALFFAIGSVASARELRAPSPPQPVAASPCTDDRDSEACRVHFKAVWEIYVRNLSKYPTTWKIDRPRRWNQTMRPGCGRPNRCGRRR